jgi:hypothetical protein
MSLNVINPVPGVTGHPRRERRKFGNRTMKSIRRSLTETKGKKRVQRPEETKNED